MTAGHVQRTLVTALLVLIALILWVGPVSATVVKAGNTPASSTTLQRTEASGPLRSHASRVGHARKQGTVAIVASVIGIIAVIVFIVVLGSVSVRRRTRDGPPMRTRSPRGPPDRGRGLFG